MLKYNTRCYISKVNLNFFQFFESDTFFGVVVSRLNECVHVSNNTINDRLKTGSQIVKFWEIGKICIKED